MIKQHRAPQESDDQAGPARDEKAEHSDSHRRQHLEFVQPHQLGKRRKIRDLHQVGRIVLSSEDPADMAVDEPLVPGRMHISPCIRVQMMVTVLCRPPQNAFLCAALGENRNDELKHPARRVGSMREVAVIARPDGEHPQPV